MKYRTHFKILFTVLPLLWIALFVYMWQVDPLPFDWRVAAGAFLAGWFVKG